MSGQRGITHGRQSSDDWMRGQEGFSNFPIPPYTEPDIGEPDERRIPRLVMSSCTHSTILYDYMPDINNRLATRYEYTAYPVETPTIVHKESTLTKTTETKTPGPQPLILTRHVEQSIVHEEFSISDFESGNEEEESPSLENEDMVSSDVDLSPSISSVSTGASNNDNATITSKKRASDWLKNLASPSKNSLPSPDDESAKKKPRFTKNGLADKLKKLQLKERSALAFWQHQTSVNMQQQETENQKVLKAQLMSLDLKYSLYVTDVKILAPENTQDSGKEWGIIFSKQTVDNLKLKPGCTVSIHPPWQKMTLVDSGTTVVLCTNYCEVTDDGRGVCEVTDDGRGVSVLKSNSNNRTETVIPFSCECAKDKGIDASECSLSNVEPISTLKPSPVSQSSASSGTGSPAGGLAVVMPTSRICQSILEGIERAASFGDKGMTLEVTVQRVFKWNKGQGQHQTQRVSLLVEDCYGSFSEIILPPLTSDTTLNWDKLEGHWCVIKRLHITRRLKRVNYAKLFAVIDSVWDSEKINQRSYSQTSQESTPRAVHVAPPGFMYKMSQDDSKNPEENCIQKEKSPLYTLAGFTPINELATLEKSEKCFSVRCRVLHQAETFLHVCDGSKDKDNHLSFVKLDLTAHQPIQDLCPDQIYIFKDIKVKDGHLVCNKYSTIHGNK